MRLGLINQALIIVDDPGAIQNSRITYLYTGLNHSNMLNAILLARAVAREVAEEGHVSIITTDGFPKDLEHFHDHVHLTDVGIAKLVELIGPQVIDLLE